MFLLEQPATYGNPLKAFFPKSIIPKRKNIRDSLYKLTVNRNPRHAELARQLLQLCVSFHEDHILPGKKIIKAKDVYHHYRNRLSFAKQECLLVVLLDENRRYITDRVVAIGILNKVPVKAREVFAPALDAEARAIILLHNHPGGDPTPSFDDRECTGNMLSVGEMLSIDLLDHVIIGHNGYYSFVEAGLLPSYGRRKGLQTKRPDS